MVRLRLGSWLAAALVGIVCSASLTACTGDGGASASTSQASSPAAEATEGPAPERVPRTLVESFSELLDERATAVMEGDLRMFRKGLIDDQAFRSAQSAYFDNLQRLPLGDFVFELDQASLVRDGLDFWVEVERTTRLRGFDATAERVRDRFRFSPLELKGRQFAISGAGDPEWEKANSVILPPWETRPIRTRRMGNVLGIFDQASVATADRVMASAARSLDQVAGLVPVEWPRKVVLYSLSDTAFQAQLPDLPGGDPDRLDGLAVSIPAGPGDDQVASTRLVLHPRVATRSTEELEQLLRHELVHVSLAGYDDRAPLWLNEGIAEYLSLRPLPPQDRRVPEPVLQAAEQGLIKDLPADEAFNGQNQSSNYALAWWACEHLVSTYGGEQILWSLLEKTASGEADPGTVLESVLQTNTRVVARKAAKRIVATYGEPPPERVRPSAAPSEADPA